MDPSRAGDLDERQPGSDLPLNTTSVSVSAAPGEAEGALTPHPSSALRESEKQAWPEWARAGESAGSDLELRRPAAGEVGGSPSVIGWGPWHGRSRTPARGATVPLGAAAVVAIAACTSVFVSLATVWLWGRTPAPVAADHAAPIVAPATKPPDVELTRAPLLVHPIGRPVALAPIIAAIKPDFPLPAFLAPPSRGRTIAPRKPVTPPSDFVVTSEPAGANVTINGVGYGPTPVTVRFLPPGPRRIRVTKTGYQSQEQVVGAEVVGSTPSVRIVLAELSGARGSQ